MHGDGVGSTPADRRCGALVPDGGELYNTLPRLTDIIGKIMGQPAVATRDPVLEPITIRVDFLLLAITKVSVFHSPPIGSLNPATSHIMSIPVAELI